MSKSWVGIQMVAKAMREGKLVYMDTEAGVQADVLEGNTPKIEGTTVER